MSLASSLAEEKYYFEMDNHLQPKFEKYLTILRYASFTVGVKLLPPPVVSGGFLGQVKPSGGGGLKIAVLL